MVSSKKGPTSGSGLSNTASTSSDAVAEQALDRDLDPGHVLLDDERAVGDARGRAARPRVAASRSSARITPRLAESPAGFTTHGSPTAATAAATPAGDPATAKRGLRHPVGGERARASPPCRGWRRRPPVGCGRARARLRPAPRRARPGRRPRPRRRRGSGGRARRSAATAASTSASGTTTARSSMAAGHGLAVAPSRRPPRRRARGPRPRNRCAR